MTPPELSVRTATLDGVRAFWTDAPSDPHGALVVGVGGRDLTPATAGLHHLLEHLVMARVGPVALPHNAESGPDSIVFWAEGDALDVQAFLTAVASALASVRDVTDEEVERERSTILRELGTPGLYAEPGPFSTRWGAAGLGLLDLDHAPLAALTAADVRDVATRWLVADNVRLALTFEPDERTALPLPRGAQPERASEVPVLGTVPGLALVPRTTSVMVGVTGPAEARALAGMVVEETLYRQLRAARGAVYEASVTSWGSRADRTLLVMVDPSPDDAAAVLLETCLAIRTIATSGPALDVLDHVKRSWLGQARSLDARRAAVVVCAERDLAGDPLLEPEAYIAALAATTADQVQAALEHALATATATLPYDAPISPEVASALESDLGLQPRHLHPVLPSDRKALLRELMAGGEGSGGVVSAAFSKTGSVHAGRWFGPARGGEIWLAPRQLSIPEIGARLRVEDLALVGEDDDGDVELVTRQGGSVLVNPANFRGTRKPWARFMANVPPEIVRSKRSRTPAPDGGAVPAVSAPARP